MSYDLIVYLQPGAKRNQIAGKHGDYFKIKVKARAVDGAANRALIEFLSEIFDIPQSSMNIIRGEKSRMKTVRIERDQVFVDKAIDKALMDFK